MKSVGKVSVGGRAGRYNDGKQKSRRDAGGTKKSPGQRPGRSFLQKEVYQPHNPLVKTKISMDARRAGTPINRIPSGVSTLLLPPRISRSHWPNTSYVYELRIKLPLAFQFT
jgi:hypothetical protein